MALLNWHFKDIDELNHVTGPRVDDKVYDCKAEIQLWESKCVPSAIALL